MSGIYIILGFAAFIWIVYDILTNERSMSNESKIIWIVCGAVFNVITAIAYYAIVKKKLL